MPDIDISPWRRKLGEIIKIPARFLSSVILNNSSDIIASLHHNMQESTATVDEKLECTLHYERFSGEVKKA
ncbi:hypothetical protein F2I40_03520 [Escherichia coli]|nr:hypothetical protein [Escherichia coli]EFN6915215.1 hypothetical protein [Escherichia coli O10]TKT77728.1 hypothetical protein FC814_17600 [Escherichia sp. MR]EFC0648453.1 hypothetical protein [Escherichia coli]EFD1057848.1 hypothetical protein [Escherichia coli]